MADINDVWSVPEGDDKWVFLEALFSLPVEKRMEWLLQQAEKKRVLHLGTTDKTAPELATECIKKGIKAKSYVAPKKTLTKEK